MKKVTILYERIICSLYIFSGKKMGKRNIKNGYNRYNMYTYSICETKITPTYSRIHISIIEFE